MNWFILALLSPVFWGIENFLYKVSGKKDHDPERVAVLFTASALIGSIVLQILFGSAWTSIPLTILFSILNSLAFFVIIQTRFLALGQVDVNYYFPVTKVGSLVLMVTFAILVRHELLTPLQGAGMALACLSIYLLGTRQADAVGKKKSSKGVLYTYISTVYLAFSFIVADLGTEQVGTYPFMIGTYACTLLLNLLMLRRKQMSTDIRQQPYATEGLVRLGITIGLFNILGSYFYLEAIRLGNFSIVSGIGNLSLVVTVACTLVLKAYREPLGTHRVGGILLAFLSIYLMR